MATDTAPPLDVVGVAVAGGTWKDDLRATKMVWKRELIRYSRNRIRIVTSLAQPILFLFVLGSGLSPIVNNSSGPQVNFKTFMFPGVIAMTILFTAIFSAVSIVWDREFGFLREMMVAPIRRGALVTGKTLGGATVATLQGSSCWPCHPFPRRIRSSAPTLSVRTVFLGAEHTRSRGTPQIGGTRDGSDSRRGAHVPPFRYHIMLARCRWPAGGSEGVQLAAAGLP